MTVEENRSLTEALRFDIGGNTKLFYGLGCESCGGTGFKGRTIINEVLVVDNQVREEILKKASAMEIRQSAIYRGMTTMLLDGVEKAKNGITTFEEVLRTVHESR